MQWYTTHHSSRSVYIKLLEGFLLHAYVSNIFNSNTVPSQIELLEEFNSGNFCVLEFCRSLYTNYFLVSLISALVESTLGNDNDLRNVNVVQE